jgi:IS30 family transposase
MTYSQLSKEERYFLSSLLARGASIPSIAKELGRSPSTLYRELPSPEPAILNRR